MTGRYCLIPCAEPFGRIPAEGLFFCTLLCFNGITAASGTIAFQRQKKRPLYGQEDEKWNNQICSGWTKKWKPRTA